MADTDIVISGLAQFIPGTTVSCWIGGLDCGDYVVSDTWSITVPIQSDPDGLLTGAYLQSISATRWDYLKVYGADCGILTVFDGSAEATVFVPVLIGYTYTSTGTLLRPATEGSTKSQQGGATGKKRRIYNYAFLFANSQGTSIGTFADGAVTNYIPVQFVTPNGTELTKNVLYTGVLWNALEDSDSYDGMVSWTITRPYPCTVNSVNSFLEVEEY